MLTPEQIAERLNVKRAFVYDLIRTGELDAVNVGGGRPIYRVHESVFDEWLKGRKV
jgi:excisionase family DNA binding protein